MKKLTYLALVLSFGLFTIGCEPKKEPVKDVPKMDGKMDDKMDGKMDDKDAVSTDAPAGTK